MNCFNVNPQTPLRRSELTSRFKDEPKPNFVIKQNCERTSEFDWKSEIRGAALINAKAFVFVYRVGKGSFTRNSTAVNRNSNDLVIYIWCRSAAELQSCPLLRPSHCSTWSPLTILIGSILHSKHSQRLPLSNK